MQPIRTSVLVAPVLILLLFANVLLGFDRLAFRDVGHFYAPLYDHVAERCASQWLPLWNPHDQTGIPLAGETTTAVFYPVRYLVFSLPIPSDVALGWYVALHLVLASLAAFLAARWSALGVVPSSIAAIVYPLSGSVLFLHTNPPFLVGAAWVPLVVGSLLAAALRTRTRLLIASAAMAMMLLGGDPQTALHGMILVFVVAVGRRIRAKSNGHPMTVLCAAPILAAAMAAPQLAASLSWSHQSDRVHRDGDDRLFDPPRVGSQRFEAFQYSLSPWHCIELTTPNAFGSLVPTNRRISRLIPGDGRMWTPSIYMGMLTLVALLYRASLSRREGVDGWMVMAMLSLFAAMGHFGFAWWIQNMSGMMPNVDSAVGGPYWILYQFLPGYDSFRYPAKWLTLFSLAAAIISAQVIERGLDPKRAIRIVVVVGLGLITAVAITALMRFGVLMPRGFQVPTDEFWGPLDVDSSLNQIIRSLFHSIVILIAIMVVICRQHRSEWSHVKTGILLLAILVLDLGISGHGMIARIPRERENILLSKLESPPPQSGHSRWMRTQSGSGWPSVWKDTTDDDRLTEVEASGRAAWFGRWHLADRTAMLNNMVSIRSLEMARFWSATRSVTSDLTAGEQASFWRSMRNWLGVDGVIHVSQRDVHIPSAGEQSHVVDRTFRFGTPGTFISPPSTVPSADLTLRIHHRWKHEELDSATTQFAEHLRSIWSSGQTAVPVVQSTVDVPLSSGGAGTGTNAVYRPNFPRSPERISFGVQLAETTLLTRPVFQDGHWRATIAEADSDQWRSIRVHKVDHLTQGVVLPAGDWKLQFHYSPWWLAWSIAISAIAWLVAIVSICSRRRAGEND